MKLLLEKRVQGRQRMRKGRPEEAPGPPAESECLERKSDQILLTFKKVPVDFRNPVRLHY